MTVLHDFVEGMLKHRPMMYGGKPAIPFGFGYDPYKHPIQGRRNVTVDTEAMSSEIWWHIFTAAGLHVAAKALGASHSAGPLQATNIVLGDALGLYRPGQVVHTAKGTAVRGSAMSMTEAAWFHRAKVGRTLFRLGRFMGPVGTALWIAYELHSAPPAIYTSQEVRRQQKMRAQRSSDRERYG